MLVMADSYVGNDGLLCCFIFIITFICGVKTKCIYHYECDEVTYDPENL